MKRDYVQTDGTTRAMYDWQVSLKRMRRVVRKTDRRVIIVLAVGWLAWLIAVLILILT